MSADRPRVLLVDDAAVMRTIMAKVLETDYEVVGSVGDGQAAVEAAEALRPDIVLMDVTMPVMNGIEATQAIRQRCPEVDVIILSAVSNDRSVYAGLAAGARDYLIKPAKSAEILQVMGRLARQRAERAGAQVATAEPPGTGMWTFVGAQGGEGRTTLVLALANELLALNKRVVVLDADMIFGDAAFYLGLRAEGRDFESLFAPDVQLSPTELARALGQHPSGLRVLGRPLDSPPRFEADPKVLVHLARRLREIADFVLVDMPVGIPDALLPLVDEARYVFPVAAGRPESLRNLKTMLEVLAMCGCTPPRCFPLVTGSEAMIGKDMGVREVFPHDAEAVELAKRERQPVTRVAPRSPLTQKVRELVGRILEVPTQGAQPAQAGVLGGLFQRLTGG